MHEFVDEGLGHSSYLVASIPLADVGSLIDVRRADGYAAGRFPGP